MVRALEVENCDNEKTDLGRSRERIRKDADDVVEQWFEQS